jgi:Repeat of unknown function (DUF5648)
LNNATRKSSTVIRRGARWTAGLAAAFLLVMFVWAAIPSAAFAFATQEGDIVFMRPSNSQLYLARSNGAVVGSLGVYGDVPKWSPEGRRIAYYDPDIPGGGVQPLVRVMDTASGSTYSLSNDLDCSWGAFCWDGSGRSILHLYDMAAGATMPEWWYRAPAVPNGDSIAQTDVFGSYAEFVRDVTPMPDGTFVVRVSPYTVEEYPDGSYYRAYQASSLVIMDSLGAVTKSAPIGSLIYFRDLAASPDGSKVVFVGTDGASNEGIFLWNLTSNSVTRLWSGDYNYTSYPRFTADGASVTWSRTDAGSSVWIMSATGASPHQFIADAQNADARPLSSTPVPLPVYRFYNFRAGTHFYTADPAEMANVRDNMKNTYSLDGVAYTVNTANPNNNTTLWRFYNVRTGTHFYTADPAEKARVQSTMGSTYHLDGPAYNVCATNVAGSTTVWRFYNMRTGTHFYTADSAEKANVQNTMGNIYSLDGPAFYLAN